MPRVNFVKAARKPNKVAAVGEPYYWWKFRFGGKHYSTTRPKPSQLTQSAYKSTVRKLVERVEEMTAEDYDDFESQKDDIKSELDSLRDEAQSSFDNIPEALQYAPTGELLQERISALEEADSNIDGIDEFDFEETEFEFEPEEFEIDEFDIEEYDTQEEYHAAIERAKQEHETAEDKRRDADEEAHEEAEEARQAEEFSEWLDNAKSELTDAISSCDL
jgi:hypothetical protein